MDRERGREREREGGDRARVLRCARTSCRRPAQNKGTPAQLRSPSLPLSFSTSPLLSSPLLSSPLLSAPLRSSPLLSSPLRSSPLLSAQSRLLLLLLLLPLHS